MANEQVMVKVIVLSGGRRNKAVLSSISSVSTISSRRLELIMERLKCHQNQQSTTKNYQVIWRNFNKFLMQLDSKPKLWEERDSLYLALLVDEGAQSSMIRLYKSAIKTILVTDGYMWDDGKVALNTINKACRLINDRLKIRMPIHTRLLEMLLFELQRFFDQQWYLMIMFRALFAMAYYGLMRIGELTAGEHQIKAKDIHIGQNKNKLLIVLHSSKTHGAESIPQRIKISEIVTKCNRRYLFFCPFKLIRDYIAVRGGHESDNDPFLIYKDGSNLPPGCMRYILHKLLSNLNLDSSVYSTHSFRIGRSSEMYKYGYSVEEIKRAGHWKSNAVYKYIRI